MAATLPPDVLSITIEAAECLLVCRWRPDAPSEDLAPVFESLLKTAQAANNCRFWLFDMRERAWHPPVFERWFAGLLAQRVVEVLGRPVFLACVANKQNRADIEHLATQVRAHAEHEFYPFFFEEEAAAREWLAYHRELDGE